MVEPVTLEEARKWLNMDADMTDDDALIGALIQSARIRAEHETGLSFSVEFPDGVPENIKTWMRYEIATCYEWRGKFAAGQVAGIPRGHVDGLLDPHRTARV